MSLYKTTHYFRCDNSRCKEVFETTLFEDYEVSWDLIEQQMAEDGWYFEQADMCYCPRHVEDGEADDAWLDDPRHGQAEPLNRAERISRERESHATCPDCRKEREDENL